MIYFTGMCQRRSRLQVAIFIFTVFLLGSGAYPATFRLYESSMMTHMLVQLPLLAWVGWLIPSLAPRTKFILARHDPHGAIAVLVFIGCSLFWMVPLHLDQAVFEPGYRLLKLVSVPIGIGLSLRWVCLSSHPIVTIIVLFELWASIARLGWLYLESPQQLCSNYLLSEQRSVGLLLLSIAMIVGIVAILLAIFGTHAKLPEGQMAKKVRCG